jgi:hypothetical protein
LQLAGRPRVPAATGSRLASAAKTTAAGRGIVPAAMCDHLFDTTSRYDSDRKLLTFLLVCPVCGTDKVVERRSYEPWFRPIPAAMRVRRVRRAG